MSFYPLKDKQVTVRKKHRCVWCGEIISIGEKAQYRVYCYDGDFGGDYMHPECYEAMLTVPFLDICDGFDPGEFKRGSTEER